MLVKNGYTIRKCRSCGLAMTEFARDYEPFVRSFYQKGYFTGDPRYGAFVHYKNDKKCINRNTAKVLTHIRKIKKTGKLLDVGCAMGFFVQQAIAAGYDAYGIDPSAYAISQANSGIAGRLRQATVATAKYEKGSFDIITLFDVFEHLLDPLTSLKKLSQLLAPGGIIVIATGDTGSLAARIFGRRWTFYNPPQHLFYYDRKTMSEILARGGIKPFRWFRVGKVLSLGYILHLAYTLSEVPAARDFLKLAVKFKFDTLPLVVPLGDNMVVIAEKTANRTE